MSDTETTTARKTETADADRRSIVEDALAMGDIQINGSRPWDIQIHDERFYKSILAEDALGLGESYMEG
ncbi:MAG: cyclopropane-fatty-acyl-phospholipid synthase, partial [Bacteroidetes bacterium]|nr:cyclopropane-fatty-acyl-phospholipid synthase [Bacteroidota bacterium]